MHIVMFVDFSDTMVGGVSTSVRAQRHSLQALGHAVTVVSPRFAAAPIDESWAVELPAIELPAWNGAVLTAPTPGNMQRIERALSARGPVDIVHVQTNMGIGIMGVRYAKKHGLPLVQTMHGRDDVIAQATYPLPRLTTCVGKISHQLFVPHRIEAFRSGDTMVVRNSWAIMLNQAEAADQVIVPSRHFGELFTQRGLTKPLEVISNGIDDTIVDRIAKLQHPTRSPESPLRVMWCSRLSSEKRLLESIEAFSRLDEGTLDIYGEGPLHDEAARLIVRLGLQRRVKLYGRISQDELIERMLGYDVLLFSSYGFDTQGMVLLEAAAAGLPVVMCDPNLAETIPSEGFILTPNPSPQAMADALRTLQSDPGRRAQMRSALLKFRPQVVQSRHIAKLVAIYEQLAGSARSEG